MAVPPQLEVHLHTNYSCNLHCRHCYNNSGGKNQESLLPELAMEIINVLCAVYDAQFHLEGGEVFLCPELLERMDTFPDSILQRLTITTNGTIRLENPRILSVLTRIGALRISVEGHTDRQQQAIRGIGLAPVLDTAAYYQRLGAPVVLRVTLNGTNYDRFVEETIPGLMRQGCSDLQIYEFQQVGRGVSSNGQFALGESIKELLTALEAQGAWENSSVKFMFPSRRISEISAHQEALGRSGFQVQLIKPENGISIHADGGVYICPWDNDKRHCLFNIKEVGLEDALKRLGQENLTHTCGHCSAIRIVC